MKTKYSVLWSQESKRQLDAIITYLRQEWTEKEVIKFIKKLKEFENLVVLFPELYFESRALLRRAVLTKHNSVIYKIDARNSIISVLTIFDNRQDSGKFKYPIALLFSACFSKNRPKTGNPKQHISTL